MARLFFALWPGEDAARALAEVGAALARRAGGKPVPAEKIHLTLAFLGEVDEERVAAARRVAAGVRGRSFALRLDIVGAFRRAGVAWAGSSQPVPELERVQSSLTRALVAAGFALEERPFAVHATIVRRIAKAVPRAPMPPVEWLATSLTLVRTQPGDGRYTLVESWAFGGPGDFSR